jgi:uncharacterized lipoprotein YddW (UPF0748 family)
MRARPGDPACVRALPPSMSLLLLAALPAQGPPPEPLREFRGAWVATVDNIDWPSRPGLPVAQQKAELDAIVNRARELRLNALVFQVRPHGDAMYASELEPWSEWLTGTQGKAPDPFWDPLETAVQAAHLGGLELHAWFNPFRARHPKCRSELDPKHPARRLPGLAVAYGDYLWLDPGDPRAADWSLRVIADVVARYDIDAVHIDDYFYPYPIAGQTFPDEASYQDYRSRGGRLGKADWRRGNIDSFVQRMQAETRHTKPWVRVGISPFGIARPGLPPGIEAGVDAYDHLHADARKWLREGLCDYLSPQLYWPIDQKKQSFATLLPWWTTQNPKARHLWPGLYADKAAAARPPWRKGELGEQIGMIRGQDGAGGYVLFSFKTLLPDTEFTRALRATNGELALAPASPWLGGKAPAAAEAWMETVESRVQTIAQVRWRSTAEHRFAVLQVHKRGQRSWRTAAVLDAGLGSFPMPAAELEAVAVRLVDRTGLAGPATVVRTASGRQ